jgi:hypothetical protein
MVTHSALVRWILSFLSAMLEFSAGDERESCCFLVQKPSQGQLER